jgi:ATP synthase protein I
MTSDLEKLGRKLDEIHAEERAEKERLEKAAREAGNRTQGLRVGVELIAPMMAGGFIGWLIDGWLGTKPLFVVIVFLLGVAAGFANVWRITQNIGSSVGYSGLHNTTKDARTAPTENDH